ncbi:MAG: hypothetical protein A2X59_08665 [Nitrospirae bacterium GWC2_42_7]|nr:MAG: hypothetical protein A2X59_08665 [Nitrospirae bacterium GWC2_42_7]
MHFADDEQSLHSAIAALQASLQEIEIERGSILKERTYSLNYPKYTHPNLRLLLRFLWRKNSPFSGTFSKAVKMFIQNCGRARRLGPKDTAQSAERNG